MKRIGTCFLFILRARQRKSALNSISTCQIANFSTSPGSSDIFNSISRGDLSNLQEQITRGASPNERNEENLTPLMFAIQKNNSDMVEYLIQNGAEIDETDDYGKSAVDFANELDRKNIKDILLRAKSLKNNKTYKNTWYENAVAQAEWKSGKSIE